MTDFSEPHLGPVTATGSDEKGRYVEYEVHGADGLNDQDKLEAVADNHGLDPSELEISKPKNYTDSKGRKGVSFAGAWANSQCKWEPEGPKQNFGYEGSVNLN